MEQPICRGEGDSVNRTLIRAILFLSMALTACGGPTEEPMRVVLISLDTLRYDKLPATVDGPTAMPLTHARARRGLQFEHFYTATSATQPSHASMFTGLHPWEHGVTRNGIPLADDFRTVAQVLEESGFETRAVEASFPLTRRFGFAAGFGEFEQDFDQRLGSGRRWEGEWKVPGAQFFSRGDHISDRAIEQIDRATGAKQFFWFHYFDPHAPYGSSLGGTIRSKEIIAGRRQSEALAQELLERAREGYAADVSYLDSELDRLFTRLERDADEIPTHIIVVADHGESFGEGGVLAHGTRVSEEQLHVPAFIISPSLAPVLRSDVAGSIDIAHTMLSLAGVEATDALGNGRDLTRPTTAKTRAFAMRKTFHGSAMEEERLDGKVHVLRGRLFCEINADGKMVRGNSEGLLPLEVAGDSLEPADRDRILDRFRVFEEMLGSVTPGGPLDGETEEALKALGYVE